MSIFQHVNHRNFSRNFFPLKNAAKAMSSYDVIEKVLTPGWKCMNFPSSLISPGMSVKAYTPWVCVINCQSRCCTIPVGCLISRQAGEWNKRRNGLGRVPGSRTIKQNSYSFLKLINVHSLSNHCGPKMNLAWGVKVEKGHVSYCPLGLA